MYRILFVEDESKTRDMFVGYAKLAMPDVDIVPAISVPDAEERIHEAVANGKDFDAVILDANLPGSDGVVKIDTTLCDLVNRTLPDAVVAHCSQFADKDDGLKRHIEREHLSSLRRPQALKVSKETGWEEKLMHELARDRVKRKLDQFFIKDEVGTPAGRSGRGGGTALAAEVTEELEACWGLLSKEFREELLEAFWVSKDKQPKVRFRTGLEKDE